MTYQKLTPGHLPEFKQLIRLFEAVFEMNNFALPPDQHLEKLLAKDDFMVFVAVQDNTVVGGLTAYVLEQYYVKQPLIYIFDLAVDPKFQRQGIGRGLIHAINGHARTMGVEEVFVQADLADTHALDFYRSTGAIPEDVVHFYYPLHKTKS